MNVMVKKTYVAKEGMEEDLGKLLEKTIVPSREQEGCLFYEIGKSKEEVEKFVLFASWEDDKAYDIYKESVSYKDYLNEYEYYCDSFSTEVLDSLVGSLKMTKNNVFVDNKEIEELKNENLRLHAEIQNQRKRFEKEKENVRLYSSEEFVKNMLVALDSVENGLKYINKDIEHMSEDELRIQYESVTKGMDLTVHMFVELFKKNNIRPISVEEGFNPEYHQAISVVNNEDCENNSIVQEVQKGYFYNDKMIRPSSVIVCKK